MKLCDVTFDEFLKLTLMEGYGEEKVSLKILDAVEKLAVLWDMDADPFDVDANVSDGLTIFADGKIVVAGTVPGMRSWGRMRCYWTGYLK